MTKSIPGFSAPCLAAVFALALGMLGGVQSAIARTIDPGFLLFGVSGSDNVLNLPGVLSGDWVGDPDNISNTDGKFPKTTSQNCGPRKFDFGDGNGCVSTGNTALIVERPVPVATEPPSNKIFLDIAALALKSKEDIIWDGVNRGKGYLRILELPGRVFSGVADEQIFGGDRPTLIDPDPYVNRGPSDTPCAPFPRLISPHGCLVVEGDSARAILSHRARLFFDSGLAVPIDFKDVGIPITFSETGAAGPFVRINGVNQKLNGVDNAADMFPLGPRGPGFTPAVIPLPPSALLFLSALGLPLCLRRKKAV